MFVMGFWTFLAWQVVLFVILIMAALLLDSMAGAGGRQSPTTRSRDSKRHSKSLLDRKESEIRYWCGPCQKGYSLPLGDRGCEHVRLLEDNGFRQSLTTIRETSLQNLSLGLTTGNSSSKTLHASLSSDNTGQTIITIWNEQDVISMMKQDSRGCKTSQTG